VTVIAGRKPSYIPPEVYVLEIDGRQLEKEALFAVACEDATVTISVAVPGSGARTGTSL